MGRPLYSSAFKTTPAVRDPEPPCCEKWSYLNAFDPDADEFFDNENAVYEDFIGPVTSLNSEDDPVDDDDDERDMLVVRMGNVSPISELSDSDSPVAVGEEDPAHPAVDAFHRIRQVEDTESALLEPAVRVRLSSRSSLAESRWESQTPESWRSYPRRGLTGALRTVSYHPYPQRDESFPVPVPSSPIPVPAVSRRSVTIDERPLLSPSTPPRQTPAAHLPMSPPPTSTPRLYSWARNPSHSTSPSSGSPFTNPHARTSYAHLSPALIRIRDVTV